MHDAFVTELLRMVPLGRAAAAAFAAVDRGDFVPAYFMIDYLASRGKWPVEWKAFSRSDPEPWAEHVYSPADGLVTKIAESGVPLVSCTDPTLQAVMIRALSPRPGDRVLEIGTGTGYNAAILSEIVGPGGLVVSVDIDEETSRSAAGRLSGRENIKAVCADGRAGWARDAPFDGIMVTGEAGRLERGWVTQFGPGGRLVMNLSGPMASGLFAGTAGNGGIDGRFLDHMAVSFTPLYGPGDVPQHHGPEFIADLTDRVHRPALTPAAAESLLTRKRDALSFVQLMAEPGRYRRYAILSSLHRLRGAVIERGPARCEIREEPREDRAGYGLAVTGDEGLLTLIADAHNSWERAGSPRLRDTRFHVAPDGLSVQAGAASFASRLFAPGQEAGVIPASG